MTNFSEELKVALKAARAGAKIVKENFGKSKESRVKGNAKGLVTATDLASEKAIIEILTSETDFEILSEECGTLNPCSGPKWVIDPLDGTSNFARSLPFFAISIGLMQGKEFLVGVIIDPVNGREFYAIKGGGAFCNGTKLVLPKFSNEYIPMLFLNHGYAETDRAKYKELSKRLASENNILKLGTTALELCYVAEGAADAFVCSGDEIWDFAAGILIAQEAGCIFTDWQGNAWDGKNNHLLVSRPEIHFQLVEKINNVQ